MDNNIIEVTINGKNVFYDVLSGCIADNSSALEEYVDKNLLKCSIDEPLADRDKMQGFFFVLTTKCNLSCKYCYSISQNKPMSMHEEDPVRIIKKFLREDAEYILINFFGGEPTLEINTIKHTVDFLKTLKNRKIYLRISTNGITSISVLDYLIDNKFHITVSSDGVLDDDSPLDKVRNAQTVDKTLRYLAKKNAIFTIRYTATSVNYKNLSKSIDYWKSIGVPLAHIEPYHPIGKSVEEMKLLPVIDDYVNVFLSAVDEAEKKGLMITTGAYMNLLTPSSYFCTGASGRFCVFNPDGSMSTCYRVQSFDSKYKEFIIGNWKTDQKESEWWTNKSNLNNHTVLDMKPCSACINKYLCSGGCLMRNLTQSGSIDKSDKWLCALKRKVLKDAIIRIWESFSDGRIPVVLGRFIFEDYLARNPSLPFEPHQPMKINGTSIRQRDGIYDIFECLGLNRNDDLMIFNRKIARTECL